MRTKTWVGRGLAVLVTVLGTGLAYTAQTSYELPERVDLSKAAEFRAAVPRRAGERTVVVLIFDGFAPATVAAADTPHLDRITREGAHASDVLPVFPTLSLPNHFSLTTGCEPARHGIVSNHFKDPERGVFHLDGDAEWLRQCEPLHAVAERQGVRAAVLGHVAGASSGRGKLASSVEAFIKPPPTAQAQADKVIALLEQPAAQRPGLIVAYVTEPDATAHEHGPTAPQTLAMAHACDAQIGRVMAGIERLGLREHVTLAVTTDHGMTHTAHMISIDRLMQRADVDATVLAEGPIAHVYLHDRSDKARALAALSRQSIVTVLDPERAPAHLHLDRSPRMGDLVVTAPAGYWMADVGLWPWYLRWASFAGSGVVPSSRFKGMHGHDPIAVPEMRAMFYAWGAEVKRGLRIEGLRTIDVHPTLAHILSIAPGEPVDGRAHAEIVTRSTSATVAVETPAVEHGAATDAL